MTVPIEFDERYKINQDIVDQMRLLREHKLLTYRQIAKKFNVSGHTAYYWINEDYRKFKQSKSAKRRHPEKEHVKVVVARTKEYLKIIPSFRLAHDYYSARADKKKRYTVHGKTMEEMEEFMKEFKQGGQKVK